MIIVAAEHHTQVRMRVPAPAVQWEKKRHSRVYDEQEEKTSVFLDVKENT